MPELLNAQNSNWWATQPVCRWSMKEPTRRSRRILLRFRSAIYRLKELGNTEPAGLLQIASNLETDYTEGSELTYLHGVGVLDRSVPEDLYAITVPAGTWAVFRTSGPYPAALQEVWASIAKQRFPSNPWMLREGPSMVAVLERAEDFSTATCELWLPM